MPLIASVSSSYVLNFFFLIEVKRLPRIPVAEHYLGKMEHRCQHCHALHWIGERLKRSSMSSPRFGQCCLTGKVSIDFVEPLPPEMYRLYAGQDADAREFRENIRRYNKAFAFTSSGGPGHLDASVLDGHGPPCLGKTTGRQNPYG